MDLKTYIKSGDRGRATTLAKRLDISPSYLSQMASGLTPISPERCVAIWQETGGLVTRQEMRPDDWHKIWPELIAVDNEVHALPQQGGRRSGESGAAGVGKVHLAAPT